MRNYWGGRRGMRCACTLACSAEWMSTGHKGVGRNIAPYSCVKGSVCKYLSEDCWGANGGKMIKMYDLPFGMKVENKR